MRKYKPRHTPHTLDARFSDVVERSNQAMDTAQAAIIRSKRAMVLTDAERQALIKERRHVPKFGA